MRAPVSAPSAPSTPAPSLRIRKLSNLALVQTEHLLSLPNDCQGGLIIQKPFYTDFAGPGAAVGGQFDHNSSTIYVIGNIHFQSLMEHGDRHDAIQTRITYAERLAEITNVRVPLRRGCLIISQLCQWMPTEHVRAIPAELIARLVGILPITVKLAWRCYRPTLTDHNSEATILSH